MVVSAPGMPQLQVPLIDPAAPAAPSQLKNVTVWEWSGVAADEGDEAAAWFSKYVERPVRLVRHLHASGLPQTVRPVDQEFAPGHSVKFADGFPLLITMEENLGSLNSQLSSNGSGTLPMNRFRPNLVLAGVEGGAWTDDTWGSVAIGGAQLSYVKPCDRCKVTTINQETGEEGTEPLTTLGQIRGGKILGWAAQRKSWTHSVFFGWNAAVAQQGTISVGDSVAVIAERA
ncbi:MOSC-domain-containing protein [Scenedesmus sp. NREL 46B-D3]|nr:MOSC-domain-containing protein [Scenedesmus sp. NREL 46B-D3]